VRALVALRTARNLLLATYRCQESVNRLEMCARTVEGQYGELQAIVVAKISPGKSAQSIRFNIKPLSLHSRWVGVRARVCCRGRGYFSLFVVLYTSHSPQDLHTLDIHTHTHTYTHTHAHTHRPHFFAALVWV
jgi:hypothetical protein